MASKIVGVLDAESQQITIERTDGSPSGPHTITITDGAYFAADRGVGEAAGGGTGAAITLKATHSFQIGDIIMGWDESTDTQLFVDTITALPASNRIEFGFSHTWQINDQFFVFDDLVGYVVARMRVQDYTNLQTVSASVSSGVWAFDCSAGTYTITFPTSTLQTWLRYSGSIALTSSSETPSNDRQMQGYLYLEKDIQRDKLALDPRASQSRSVTGQIETLYRTALRTRAIRIRTQGPPRSTLKTTYQAAEDLWSSHFAQGKRWRCHVDASVETPWALFTNPRGYEVFVHLGPSRWDPDLLARGYDNYLDATIPAQVYVP